MRRNRSHGTDTSSNPHSVSIMGCSPKVVVLSTNKIIYNALSQVCGGWFDVSHTASSADCCIKKCDIVIIDGTVPGDCHSEFIIKIGASQSCDIQAPLRIISLLEAVKAILLQKPYQIGQMQLLPQKRTLTSGDRSILLTEKEVALILYLFSRYPECVPKTELLERIWNYSEEADTSTIEVHLSRLRQKLNDAGLPDFILYKNKSAFLALDIIT